MSRSDEVNKMTENVYKGILDQFNPSLKNFVTMGKHYEKALTGVTVAAKGYFDGLVKLGELASDSQGSKELGDTLFQMAEVHRQIQVQLEDVLKLFHSELLSQLEQKLELDIKYLTATLKKYQSERKSKSESIERCQSQLKKLRRKSQGSRHPNKYGDREMQYVELMSRRQAELDTLVAVGYRSALTEERRRYCFLVDRQCSVTKLLINYHCKVRELLSQKLSSWQQSCSQPTRLPERALNLLRHTAPQGSGASGIAELLRHAKLGAAQPEQRLSVQEVPPLLNGGSKQQKPIPSSSQSDIPPPQHSPGPQTFRSLAATGGAIGGSGAGSPQQTSTPISVSASPNANNNTSDNAITTANTPTTSSTSSTVGSSQAQQTSLLLATSTSSLSPSLIPSTVLSLSQSSPSYSSLQGLALPLSLGAPHSPPLPHSAPLSRAITPSLHHQGVLGGGNTPLLSHNPILMKAAEMYGTSTLPLPRRPVSEARVGGFMGSTLPRDRVLPLSSPSRVEAIFAHAPGGSEGSGVGGACLLHFLPGDALSLLISEPRDGWHYGQNERTGRKGWFPFSYTQPYPNTLDPLDSSSPLLSKVNSTSTGQLDKLVSPGLPALTPESEEERSFPPQRVSTFRPRPYSMADSNQFSLRPKVRGEGVEWAGPPDRPALSMLMQELSSDFTSPPPSPTWTNPFAHVRLRKTVTNDRSAPIIE
ncbi:brain-specific angiogenesis inhibitor 1-associated protein 2-like [Oncorhynchus kisutch]|uniref:BAR/IMD domain-containing adapter protein 2 n=1 Tax=Oncorhynchus kisutch TaxID=8019 RepID=A0A8C7CED8_ONCKI|nr:brain-specific angiogenesis inhibitor 1-associated protein 2-like [Oncorhynchus kisutch]XP_020332037.2 brain-specific angiogenesis inhibitor 1-associated protein 2-like [Oncorhynchus kisutch]XP_031693834.1 brain-specific angiogenesis inhibitor 1-associated protein 2-like [Oncorhynchus kisutch]